jgi:hypothetical protein
MRRMKTCAAFACIALASLLSFSGDTGAQTGQPARLANVSTRMKVLTGDDVMIAGFIVGGSTSKTVAVVATGPSLAQFGVGTPLANPTLTLVRSSDQATIAANDDWQSAPNAAAILSAGFAPSDPLESAILMSLPPGAYTAIVAGASGGTGVAVAAAYEVGEPQVPLVNISTRGRVLTGSDVMIGGFVVSGTAPKRVAVVASGPSLTQYGIADPMPNPTLALVRSSDQLVLAANDDWQSGPNAALLQGLGLSPSHPQESAILETLSPGAYTAILSGVANGTGVGVLGVYEVPAPSDAQVLSTSPANAESAVSVLTPVTITFSRPMDPATLDTSTIRLAGPAGTVPGTVTASGNTATFTPSARLLTEAHYTLTVTMGVRDLEGNHLPEVRSFAFLTRADEPPPIVAGCPAPEAGSEVRRLDHPAPPKVFRRNSAHVTSFRLPRPGAIRFLQGQMPITPPSPYTELAISRCPGVIEPNLHSKCRLTSPFALFNEIAAVDRPLTDNQDAASGCLAPSTEQYYVNVRWTFPSCPWGSEQCGFSIQWAE